MEVLYLRLKTWLLPRALGEIMIEGKGAGKGDETAGRAG